MKTVSFENQTYQFPDDFTDQEISSALASSGSSPSAETTGTPTGDMGGLKGGAMALGGGFIEGLPVVGPAAKGGIDKAIAGARSLIHGTSYEDELKGVQNRYQSAAAQNPTLNTAGEITGGTLPYVAAGAYAPFARALGLSGSLGSQILLGGGTGAAINAADAAIRGGDPVTAGAIGAGMGVGAPVLGAAASKIASPVTSAVRGFFNPAKEAERRVGTAVARDVANNDVAMSMADRSAAVAAGQPITAMEGGGETTRALADSAASTSPEGRALLKRTLDERFATQGNRVNDWLNSQFNYPDAFSQQQALEAAAKTTNDAAYKQAYKQGMGPNNNGLWSPELERLTESNAVLDAMKTAAKNFKDDQVLKGQHYAGLNPRVSFDENGAGGMVFAKKPDGTPIYPDLRYWDLVRRTLGDAAKKAGYGTDEARRLGGFAGKLNTALDNLVPSYQAARQGAAEAFGAQDALEAGQKFVNSRMSNSAAASALGKMSPAERKLFQDGYISALTQKVSNASDRIDLTKRLATSEQDRNRLALAMGPQRAQDFIGMLNREKAMNLARDAVEGNSQTARRLAELTMAGGAYEFGTGGNPLNVTPSALTYAALGYGLGRGRRAINTNVSKEAARILASPQVVPPMRLPATGPSLTSIIGRGALPAITQSMLGPVQPLPGQQRLLRQQ